MPVRHNILSKMVIGLGRGIFNVARYYAGAFVGRRVGPLFLHCTRLYPLTDITDPKSDIDSFKNIFQVTSPVIEQETKDAIETSASAWEASLRPKVQSTIDIGA